MTDELKPCPWCGSHAAVFEGVRPALYPSRRFKIQCSKRGFECPVNVRTRYYDTEAEAIAAWNARPEPGVQGAAGILDQVEAVQDAYTRWMLSRAVGDPEMEHREAQRLSSALFALFDGGPEPDDKPCALVAALHAIAEKEGE